MILQFHKHFTKQLKKLSAKERRIVQQRLELFLDDPFDSRLRNHALSGKYSGYRSITIRPDLRALYKQQGKTAVFVYLGSHAQLYK